MRQTAERWLASTKELPKEQGVWEMLARRPDLPSHMEGGLENPLGARALYLFQGNKDTHFRIH
jgi:lipoprotein-anchoring transpeptidase ErfK/SrfK